MAERWQRLKGGCRDALPAAQMRLFCVCGMPSSRTEAAQQWFALIALPAIAAAAPTSPAASRGQLLARLQKHAGAVKGLEFNAFRCIGATAAVGCCCTAAVQWTIWGGVLALCWLHGATRPALPITSHRLCIIFSCHAAPTCWPAAAPTASCASGMWATRCSPACTRRCRAAQVRAAMRYACCGCVQVLPPGLYVTHAAALAATEHCLQ